MSELSDASDVPRTFTDGHGVEWLIRIDINGLRRCRDIAGFDITDCLPGAPAGLEKALENPITTADTLAALLKPAIEGRGMSPEEFIDGLTHGDILKAAKLALNYALMDFMPAPENQLFKTGAEMMDQTGWTLKRAAAMLETFGNLLVERPASLASTRARTRSAKSKKRSPRKKKAKRKG